jgi:carbon-monoxide dehydrogenase small subunit
MLIASQEYLLSAERVTRAGIRAHLSGNYCRCTGYEAIVDAVEKVAALRGLPSGEGQR